VEKYSEARREDFLRIVLGLLYLGTKIALIERSTRVACPERRR
jgi:hypothetical protein